MSQRSCRCFDADSEGKGNASVGKDGYDGNGDSGATMEMVVALMAELMERPDDW